MNQTIVRILATLFLIGSSTYVTQAATLQDLEKKQDQATEELEKYRALQEEQHHASSTYAQQIKEAENRIQAVSRTINETASAVATKEKEIATLEGEMAVVRNRLDQLKDEQNNTLIQMYELQGASPLKGVVLNHSLSRYEDEGEYIGALERHLDTLIVESIQLKESQESKKKKLDSDKGELLALKEKYNTQKLALISEKDQTDYLRTQSERMERTYDQLADEAEAKKREFDKLIADALRSRQSVIRKGHVNQGDIIGYMGNTGFSTGPHLHFSALRNGNYINPRSVVGKGLAWPFDSFYVSQEYGPAGWKNSLYSQHNGIDMIANSGYGAPVRAAASGDIIDPFPQYNGWMPGGYGHYVVIDHGNGLWSLYGHLIK